MRALLVSVLSLVACGHAAPETNSPPPPSSPPTTTVVDDTELTCTVEGVANAHAVTFTSLPTGCRFTRVGSPEAPALITAADDLASVTHCADGSVPPLDLSTNDVYVYSFSMGPAYAGGEVVDDGATVTMIERDRPPCPNDPMPYPMPSSIYALLLPHGATRTFRQLACSLPLRCP